MNRKLIVSILAIILVVAMVLSLVLAALPATFGGNTAVTGVFDTFSAICATAFGIAA